MNTPRDILNYVLENNLEFDFINAITKRVENYSIAEITDREYNKTDSGFNLISKSYSIDIPITDDDVLTALYNGLVVSSFISRYNDSYQVHFLVHQYPTSMKAQFDDNILTDVINYMILKTIITLRLDTAEKVNKYLGK